MLVLNNNELMIEWIQTNVRCKIQTNDGEKKFGAKVNSIDDILEYNTGPFV